MYTHIHSYVYFHTYIICIPLGDACRIFYPPLRQIRGRGANLACLLCRLQSELISRTRNELLTLNVYRQHSLWRRPL